jgi:hypothetical protein
VIRIPFFIYKRYLVWTAGNIQYANLIIFEQSCY